MHLKPSDHFHHVLENVMKLTLRACAAGSSSSCGLVLAGDVLHAGDLCCLNCAVKHCYNAVWYILSWSDCFADRLLLPAIVPKPSRMRVSICSRHVLT